MVAALLVAPAIECACALTLPMASSVWAASCFTSLATTAKPLPASPARAASMVAFRASSLVWPAIERTRTTTSAILPLADERLFTVLPVAETCCTARCLMLVGGAGDRLHVLGSGLHRGTDCLRHGTDLFGDLAELLGHLGQALCLGGDLGGALRHFAVEHFRHRQHVATYA